MITRIGERAIIAIFQPALMLVLVIIFMMQKKGWKAVCKISFLNQFLKWEIRKTPENLCVVDSSGV